MPWDQIIIDLPKYKIEEVKEVGPKTVRFFVRYEGEITCPHCQGVNLRKKDRFWRRVRHWVMGHHQLSELWIRAYQYFCRQCCCYFHPRFPGILPFKRSSETFRKQVAMEHHEGIAQRTLSKRFRLSSATIERWYQDFVHLEVQKQLGAACPKVLGIDEHFFTRKRGYATTLCDLRKHRVYDVHLGRSEKALGGFFEQLKERDNVQIVLMDLAEPYRCLCRKYFPRAKIVADRFHVIRLVNHHFLEVWKQLDPKGRKHRGLLSLMRRHPWKLRKEQGKTLRKYLLEVPGLLPLYEFKQRLIQMLLQKTKRAKECKRLIPAFLQLIEDLKNSGFERMKTLGFTLERWQEEIVRMWRFSKTNSITEGFHNKMEMLSRRAYGFRNFENYRLRVKVHCG